MWKSSRPTEDDAAQAKRAKPPLATLISVADFVHVASHALTPKTWAFYSSAATDLVTHRQNRELLRRIMVLPRVLRDVSVVSQRRTILGCDVEAPFFISPAAMARLAHPDGELAMARAAASEGIIQCISSNASYTLPEIVSAGRPGQPFFFQLYVNTDRSKTRALLQQALHLGVKAILLTVDAPVPGKREADERLAAGEGASSAMSGATAKDDKKGGGLGRLMGQYIDKSLSWADLPWIREATGGHLPIVLKGVQTVEDAKLAAEHGVDAIFLSNHGGRSLDTSQPSILSLLELRLRCPELFSKMEIYVDGGFDRGLDVLKALALGATAVGLGRPFMYSVVYGQEGTEHLIQILKDEIEVSMRLLGVTSLDQLTPEALNTSVLEPLLRDLSKFRPIPARTAPAKL